MNTLFIGLGGVGCGTLEFLSSRMEEYNRHLLANRRPAVTAKYIYIDTDNRLQRENPAKFQLGTNKIWKSLSAKSPDQLKEGFVNMGDESWREWYDAGSNPYALTMGADAKRQYSRLAFKEKNIDIRTTLYNLIDSVRTNNGRIYVITGSCGGTGCGIYMDVLYMIAEIFSNLNTDEQSTDVRLIMAMPEGYLDKDDETQNVKKHQGQLNAFATLTELDAMCKQKNNLLFGSAYVGTQKKEGGTFRPFHFGYFYDSAGLSRDEVSQRISDYLFEIELAGNNTNIVAQQGQYNGSQFDLQMTNEVNAVWDRTINDQYVKAFCSLGQFSIEKADELYRQYFADRLLFEAVNEGLIGTKDKVDRMVVNSMAETLTEKITESIEQWVTGITNTITNNDFDDETKFNDAFSVFTPYSNRTVPFVRNVLAQKDSFLADIEQMVYTYCRNWLKKYDFTTVYEVMNETDVNYYNIVVNDFNSFAEKVSNAKADSYGGIRGKTLKPEKAKKQFEDLLKTWLTIRAAKALSSGPEEDIKIEDKGYLDICKSFIQLAKKTFDISDIQGWETNFKKRVNFLKAKEDRRFIPDLNTIIDNTNEIVKSSEMVITYENHIRKEGANANLAIGTCSPNLLHEKVIRVLERDTQLAKKMNIDNLFYPDILSTSSSLRQGSKSNAFLGKYKEALKKEIDEIIRINTHVNQLFAIDVVTKLKDLDENEKSTICLAYSNYEETQLKTVSLGEGANQVYKFSYSNFQGDTAIMKQLGILDERGAKPACTDNEDDEFFSDKIVKLIVKTGFNIGHYRHFNSYKHYAAEQLVDGYKHNHDPFIDKRFLGEPGIDGKYPCDVSAALRKISEEAMAAERAGQEAREASALAEQYSLDNCESVEIYKYCLALLYEYFNTLHEGGKLDADVTSAIILKSGTHVLEIKQRKYHGVLRKFILDSTAKQVDLDTVKTVRNRVDLSKWIDYIKSKKDLIENEIELYANAITDFDLKLSDQLIGKITQMMGGGREKPVYDFFDAYLNLM